MKRSYLFLWNPESYDELRMRWVINEDPNKTWSCGNLKDLHPGATFYMMRLGVEPKGIVGRGKISGKKRHRRPHWDIAADKSYYIAVSFDELFREEPIIPLATLQDKFPDFNWTPHQARYLDSDIASWLDRLWKLQNSDVDSRKVPKTLLRKK